MIRTKPSYQYTYISTHWFLYQLNLHNKTKRLTDIGWKLHVWAPLGTACPRGLLGTLANPGGWPISKGMLSTHKRTTKWLRLDHKTHVCYIQDTHLKQRNSERSGVKIKMQKNKTSKPVSEKMGPRTKGIKGRKTVCRSDAGRCPWRGPGVRQNKATALLKRHLQKIPGKNKGKHTLPLSRNAWVFRYWEMY